MSNPLPYTPSIAILIDCWKSPQTREAYKNIVQWCRQKKGLRAVLLATYPNHDIMPYWSYQVPTVKNKVQQVYFLPKELPTWEVSRQYFSGQNPEKRTPDHLARWWQLQESIESMFQGVMLRDPAAFSPNGPFLPFSQTDNTILEMILPAGVTFMNCWTMDQLTFLCNEHWPEVNNLYFFGGSWNSCIQHRALGVEFVMKAIVDRRFRTPKKMMSRDGLVYGDDGKPIEQLNDINWRRSDDDDQELVHKLKVI